ncbi:MAG: diadenylate cyclase CdaA [Synergistaceae bacterium]|jgi:diadenylate cyclase|nr:diadenylate cyclase CdaA [Synergistaceae bacterium]
MWYWVRLFFDIFIVSSIIYRILILLVGTRAVQLVKGFLLLGTSTLLAAALELHLVSWFLKWALGGLMVALPMVFQPEVRKMLEEIGRGNLWRRRMDAEEADSLSREIVAALSYMKLHKIGALLVLEQETGLRDYWRTAVRLDARISQELLICLFWKDNPLHDGAVIMDRDGLVAGGCYLPLTDNTSISRWYGTRHRAALGISDVSDAMALVVSEERGEVTLAYNGHLSKNLKDVQLQKLLFFYFSGAREAPRKTWKDKFLRLLQPLWSK